MKTTLLILAALSLSAGLAHAQPAEEVGPPPVFKIVDSADKAKGVIAFRETVYRSVSVQKEIEEIVNGVKVKKLVTEVVTVAEERMIEFNVAKSRFITPDGKKVALDDFWKRVKAKSVIVVSADGNAPAQAYLRALNAETIVLIPDAPKGDPILPPKKE